jgi:magnesium transporter
MNDETNRDEAERPGSPVEPAPRPEHELEQEEEASPPVDPIIVLHDNWASMDAEERESAFRGLARTDAEELFFLLTPAQQAELILILSPIEQRSWVRLLAPDDAADLIQQVSDSERYQLISLLDEPTRREVTALLAYAEDHAGGLMSSRYIRLRPDMSVEEAIRYLRAQAKTPIESIYYCYVLDSEQKLLGTVSFRELFLAAPEKRVRDIMKVDLVTLPEDMDQEEVTRLFGKYSLMALPVVDSENRMKGIVTVDDVVEVVEEEATEDIQKLGGTQALEAPYLATSLGQMIRKRAGWLTVLFVGELLTASAMDRYQADIERAVVLALFVPLIISSGGNSGSQASTLIIRALALNEVRLRDWWRIFTREIITGLLLGLILGSLGLLRIAIWPGREALYGPHYLRIGLTVSLSLVGVTLWGSVAGSMLPFLLRRLGFDPASASAPAVATLVDVTGLIIYFTLAQLILGGVLL